MFLTVGAFLALFLLQYFYLTLKWTGHAKHYTEGLTIEQSLPDTFLRRGGVLILHFRVHDLRHLLYLRH
jgi:hypothetical protein